jgi:hypothetical protein
VFDVFLREAVGPFVLVAGDTRIVIEHPPSVAVAALDLVDTPAAALRLLLDASVLARVGALFEGQPASAMAGLTRDVREHFGVTGSPPGGWAALVNLLDRYGAALEADLFERTWDLLDFFRGVRPWPQLLRLMDHLPPLSHFRRAVADDDDLARRAELAALGRPSSRGAPSLAHWTEMDDLIATLTDGFTLVQLAIASANTPKGKSPPKFRPTPRPRSAWQRAQSRRDETVHQEIVAQLLPPTLPA